MVVGKDTPIVCSINNTEIVKKYFNNVSYIPLSIKVRGEVKKLNLNSKIQVLCVSKLDQKRKNQILLIDTLNKIDNRSFELTLIGSKNSNNKYYKQLIRKVCFSFPTLVYIQANLTNNLLINCYKDYDLFILPAYNEPCNYAMLEAMATGLPVVSNRDNGSSDYLNDHRVLFDTQKQLISAIEHAIIYHKIISKENLSLIKQNHNPVKNVKKIVRLLCEL